MLMSGVSSCYFPAADTPHSVILNDFDGAETCSASSAPAGVAGVSLKLTYRKTAGTPLPRSQAI